MSLKNCLVAALFTTIATPALPQGAGNIVQNGGFETGNFAGWTFSGSANDTFVSLAFPHSGVFGALFGALDTPDYIAQALPTSPGQAYLLSFWFASGDSGGGTPNEFIVEWGGDKILDVTNLVSPAWTNMQFMVTATTTATSLRFGGWDNQDYILLDDISVTVPGAATPPAFEAVTKTNGMFGFSWGAVTGRVYQLQYKTNLIQTNWIDLGGSIMATNATMSAVDAEASDPQRFYRIVLLP